MGPDHGTREASIEVTTDQKAKRGQVVSEQAWSSWLYSGGHATLCSPQVQLPMDISVFMRDPMTAGAKVAQCFQGAIDNDCLIEPTWLRNQKPEFNLALVCSAG